MFFRFEKQMAERGVADRLKAENQIEGVARMNNIRSKATETVNSGLIYT